MQERLLVEIIDSLGSTPRPSGTWMLVDEQGIEGTIGGGTLEYRAIKRAREMLIEEDEGPKEIELPLGPALSQCCGGYVKLRISSAPDDETLEQMRRTGRANWPEVWLFGAGHVGKALVRSLSDLPIRVVWIDGRAEEFPVTIPSGVEKRVAADPVGPVDQIPEDAAILVMTHEHALDLAIVERALQRASGGFLGLIGSATKRARFERHLKAQGLDTKRLICPIGLRGITGKEPAVIAASVTSQLLLWFDASINANRQGMAS